MRESTRHLHVRNRYGDASSASTSAEANFSTRSLAFDRGSTSGYSRHQPPFTENSSPIVLFINSNPSFDGGRFFASPSAKGIIDSEIHLLNSAPSSQQPNVTATTDWRTPAAMIPLTSTAAPFHAGNDDALDVDAPLPSEEFCAKTHIVSTETIIKFTEDMDAILFVCTLISSLLQLYVMYAAVHHIRGRTSDKCMHVFLLSMTFADFILTALCYPVELAPRAGLIQKFPKYVSATMHMLCWIALIVSSISLVFLNLDKLFYFRFPLRYTNFFTRARAIVVVAACWICSSLFVVFAWLTNSFHCVDEDCVTLAIFPNRLHIYVPFMIFVGVIPTLTSLFVAIYIMKIVAAHRKQMTSERLLCPPTAPGRSNSVFASRMRTFYFIFMTTVFTAITLLPYRLAGLQRSLNPGRMHECMTIMLFWIMMYMIYLHSIINPLITVTVLPQYRMGFFNAILCGQLARSEKKNQAKAFLAPTLMSSEDRLAPMQRNRLPSEL